MALFTLHHVDVKTSLALPYMANRAKVYCVRGISVTATLQRSSHHGDGDHTSEDSHVIWAPTHSGLKNFNSHIMRGSTRNRDSFHLVSTSADYHG